MEYSKPEVNRQVDKRHHFICPDSRDDYHPQPCPFIVLALDAFAAQDGFDDGFVAVGVRLRPGSWQIFRYALRSFVFSSSLPQ